MALQYLRSIVDLYDVGFDFFKLEILTYLKTIWTPYNTFTNIQAYATSMPQIKVSNYNT